MRLRGGIGSRPPVPAPGTAFRIRSCRFMRRLAGSEVQPLVPTGSLGMVPVGSHVIVHVEDQHAFWRTQHDRS